MTELWFAAASLATTIVVFLLCVRYQTNKCVANQMRTYLDKYELLPTKRSREESAILLPIGGGT